jgi:hypothetical protein
MSAPGHGDHPIDYVTMMVGAVMSSSTRNLELYSVSAIEQMLRFAVEEDVPDLERHCRQELQLRRQPRAVLPADCVHCGERVRPAGFTDREDLWRNGSWLHDRTGVPACDIAPRVATPSTVTTAGPPVR